MKSIIQFLGLIVLATHLVGCGTVQQAYKPAHLGNLADQRAESGIEVTISPDKYRARIGEPVAFKIIIRNVSSDSILFPADPDLLLTWVYPDGRRDNLIRGDRKSAESFILLAPGEEHIAYSVVTTYYFDRGGIHEFRAIVRGEALAMKKDRSSWQGRAVSNGYGLLFEEN